jgi:protein gp37
MMQTTKIEWADATWNPVTGCTKVSPGCQHCYAERMATRLRGRFGYPADDPFDVTAHRERLSEPLHWKKPWKIFVCSMSDLFHEDVPPDVVLEVYEIAQLAPQHTFIVLTKRPDQMIELFYGSRAWEPGQSYRLPLMWPTPQNVWHLVSVEAQFLARQRIGALLELRDHADWPVLGVSVEPMLGPVDLSPWIRDLDWVICGAETGPHRRPLDGRWAVALRDQCIEWNVPFFFKRDSMGLHTLDGQVWEQYPKTTA